MIDLTEYFRQFQIGLGLAVIALILTLHLVVKNSPRTGRRSR